MNNSFNNPAIRSGGAIHLAFLSGGPLDSLLAQLAGTRTSQPHTTFPLPIIAPDGDARQAARPAQPGDPDAVAHR